MDAKSGLKPLKEKVSVTLDSDVIEDIRRLADEDERSLSQYINLILKKYLHDRNKKVPARSSGLRAVAEEKNYHS